ncbi:hypothetical protein DVH24_027649 [Malus domestica]|uniref:Uncharacterized protein n=1 Tax=Malus domestica TaxID=3750 RepID=A0A498HCC7_MALDO|nr:hypothetical protein DVH24_027649 [Malus domestica]
MGEWPSVLPCVSTKSMAFESQSLKKETKYSGGGVCGDVFSMAILPKEVELEKEAAHPKFELRLQLPDLSQPLRDLSKKREVGEFLSGALAGAMTKAVLAPLETIRSYPVHKAPALRRVWER